MGKTVGGTRQKPVDILRRKPIRRVDLSKRKSINEVQNETIRKELNKGVLAFQSNYGVPSKNLFVVDGPSTTFGWTYAGDGEASDVVYLNAKWFDGKDPQKVLNKKKYLYKEGWSTRTKNGIQHTIVHELAHRKWNTGFSDNTEKRRKFRSLLTKLYNEFKKDVARGSNPIGEYATTNINEFFAETMTKSVIGTTQNKYSRSVRRLVKKYL